jgi:CheY-like chemotaxis protein
VDDEEMIIRVGGQMLRHLGYEVMTAASGKEALDVYERYGNRIHMVILDVVMPDMSGGETYDRLKEKSPATKVLLSSGYSIDGQAHELIDRGCSGFIQKPFNLAELSQKVRDILDAG